MRVLQLTITGGEPLARPDFAELWGEISSRPFRLFLNTNGTLIDGAVVRILRDTLPRLGSLMLGLDGSDSGMHDSLRGQGAFDGLLRGVEHLRGAEIPFGFYCTVTTANRAALARIAQLALDSGADWIKFNYFVHAGPESRAELRIPPEERRPIGLEAKRLAGLWPGRVSGTVLQMEELAERALRGDARLRGSGSGCGAGWSRFAVLPDGSVAPCDHLCHIRLGNLLEHDLPFIVESCDASREFRRMLERGRRTPRAGSSSGSEPGICADCPWETVCPSGCPVQDMAGCGVDGPRDECLRLYLRNGAHKNGS
jgi:radical SAM protein with 4Fe4S-binding SPASM domain